MCGSASSLVLPALMYEGNSGLDGCCGTLHGGATSATGVLGSTPETVSLPHNSHFCLLQAGAWRTHFPVW